MEMFLTFIIWVCDGQFSSNLAPSNYDHYYHSHIYMIIRYYSFSRKMAQLPPIECQLSSKPYDLFTENVSMHECLVAVCQ